MVFAGKDTLFLYMIVLLLLLPLCLSCKLYHVFCFMKNMNMRSVFQDNRCMFYYGSNCMHGMLDFPGDAVLDLLAALLILWIRYIAVSCLNTSFGLSSAWAGKFWFYFQDRINTKICGALPLLSMQFKFTYWCEVLFVNTLLAKINHVVLFIKLAAPKKCFDIK